MCGQKKRRKRGMNGLAFVEACKLKWALLFVSLAVSFTTSLVAAQAAPSKESTQVPTVGSVQSPLCDPGEIDGTFSFQDEPAGAQTVTVHLLNQGTAACQLSGEFSPTFAVDGHAFFMDRCWLCGPDDKPLSPWALHSGSQILLAPGKRAAVDLRWASKGESCQWADWVDFVVRWAKQSSFLFIPNAWPLHLCSAVKSSGYHDEVGSPFFTRGEGASIRVSVSPKTVYFDEPAVLHVELTGLAAKSQAPAGCADLYTVRRNGSIQTRLDPLLTLHSQLVDSYTPEQIEEDRNRAWPSWKKDLRRRCDIASGEKAADAEMQAMFLAEVTHIDWRTAPTKGATPETLSIPEHFEVLDVDSLAPNWGEPVNGIRTGLSIDRENFKVGDRVPLHIRMENVNASSPLGESECGEPEPDVEVQDSQHNVLLTVPTYSCVMVHGWGPFEIAKGKPWHIFREFTTASDPVPATLPGPGVYFLVSVWSPRVLEKSDAESSPHRMMSAGKMGAAYAVARSAPVRIEVVPRTVP